MYIYKITNLINDKIYIGQTTQSIQIRWGDHVSKANNGYKYAISNAIKKYGKDSFKLSLISRCCCIEEMNQREIYYIKLFNSKAPLGYNIEDGGKNSKLSESTKKKISQKLKGRKLSKESIRRREETKRRLGTPPPMLGKKFGDDYKQKKRDILLKRIAESGPITKGMKHTEQSKLNMALGSGAKQFSVFKKKDMVYIGTWTNQSECARLLGLDRAKISEILLNKTNRKTHRGCVFKYGGGVSVNH